jgi:hypothetical protein
MKDDQDKKTVIAVLGLLIAAVLLCWGFVHVVESKSEVSKQCSNAACPCEDCTCNDCKCGIEPEQGAGSPGKPPGKSQVLAPKPKLEMFSVPNCPPCKTDKSQLGSWVDAGWDVTVWESDFRESGKMYPWYKVTEVDGRQYTFQGPLSTDKVERERRNASGTGR